MLRITLSLAFVALGVAFSNTPHTGCNDAAPEVPISQAMRSLSSYSFGALRYSATKFELRPCTRDTHKRSHPSLNARVTS